MSEDTTIEKRVDAPRTADEIAQLLSSKMPVVAAAAFYDPSGQIKGALIQGNRRISRQMLDRLARTEPYAKYFVEEKDGQYRVHPKDKPGKVAFAPARMQCRTLTPSQRKMELANILGTFQEYATENLNSILDYFVEPGKLDIARESIKDNLARLLVPDYPKASQFLKESVDWEPSINIALIADGLWQAYAGCQHRGELAIGILLHRIGAYVNEGETPEEYNKALAGMNTKEPTLGEISHRVVYSLGLPTAAVVAKLITNHIKPEDWRSKVPVAKIAAIAREAYNWLEDKRNYGPVLFRISSPQAIANFLVSQACPPKGKAPGGLPTRTGELLSMMSDSPNYIKSE